MLTKKQSVFCNEYIKYGNASKAYGIAYPKSLKWRGNTRSKRASELLRHPGVKDKVEAMRRKAENTAVITRREALEMLSIIARFHSGLLLGDDGVPDPQKIIQHGPAVKNLHVYVDPQGGVHYTIESNCVLGAIKQIRRLEGWDKSSGDGSGSEKPYQLILNLGGVTAGANTEIKNGIE